MNVEYFGKLTTYPAVAHSLLIRLLNKENFTKLFKKDECWPQFPFLFCCHVNIVGSTPGPRPDCREVGDFLRKLLTSSGYSFNTLTPGIYTHGVLRCNGLLTQSPLTLILCSRIPRSDQGESKEEKSFFNGGRHSFQEAKGPLTRNLLPQKPGDPGQGEL